VPMRAALQWCSRITSLAKPTVRSNVNSMSIRNEAKTMSLSNNHHRKILGHGPPPSREEPPQWEHGQCCPRSPEVLTQASIPRNTSPELLSLVTKSPHSIRTIKKGRLDGDTFPVPLPTLPIPTVDNSTKTHAPRPEPSTPSKEPTPSYDRVQAKLDVMTADLERTSRTIEKLLLDTTYICQALQQLCEQLSLETTHESAPHSQTPDKTPYLTATTQKKTYAEATSTTKSPPGPTLSHHLKTGTSMASPPRSTSSIKLVVDFDDNVPVHWPFLNKLKDDLDDFFGHAMPQLQVTCIQFSHKGNLLLSITPPDTAYRLLSPADGAADTISFLCHSLGLSEEVARRTSIYTANTLHRIVVRDIPLRDAQEGLQESLLDQNIKSIRSDWEEYNSLARFESNRGRRAFRVLVSNRTSMEELKAKGSVSILLAFHDIEHAHRLIQKGAFIHGMHRMASLYTPRYPRAE
jgi:hypothetical protein